MTVASGIAGDGTARQRLLQERAAVAAIIAVWLAASAWARPLMLPDEGRYVAVAWEMLRSGDWLTPTLDGMPYFHKPPLFYWITAASMSLFGAHPWAARAAPLLGAWLGAFALHAFARGWTSDEAARVGMRVLLVLPLFYVGGQFANLDMLVAGCIVATVVLLAHAALSAERGLHHRAARESAYAMAALGVLAKGLIGAVLPAMVVVAWLVLRRRWPALRSLVSWRGALLFAALACPWFVAMQWRYGDFLHYFFVVQHFQRYAAGGFNNAQPFWFYPVVLAALSLPFLPWLGPAFGRGFLRDAEQGPVRLLMVVWIVVVVAFFSLPRSKLLGYVLPAVPPLALLVADARIHRFSPSARVVLLWRASLGVSLLVSLGAVILLALHPVHSTRELALVLGEQRAPNEPVYMLNGHYVDVPFYARLESPVHVVDDWSSPEVQRRDDWRKELADARRFAAAAPSPLLEPGELPASLCLSPVNWVIGASSAPGSYPFLRDAQELASLRGTTLWRVATRTPRLSSGLRCPGTPNGGSPGR